MERINALKVTKDTGFAEITRRLLREVPVLETDRLRLRAPSLEDAEDIFAFACDPEVARYVTWDAHRHRRDSEAYIAAVIGRSEAGEGVEWAMEHRKDNIVIGTCSFFDWCPAHGRAELGYTLSRRYWGRGLTTEAVRAMVAFGFQRMHLQRIQARVMQGNVASVRVLQKAGLVSEGTLRRHLFCRGAYHDVQVFSILKSEYFSSQPLE